MPNMNAGFCIFFDWVEVLNDLDPADAMAVIRAIADYEKNGVDPVEAVPKHVRAVMFAQIKRREQVSEARAKAGRASAEARSVDVCSNNAEQNSTSVEQDATTITKTITETITKTDNNNIYTSSNEEVSRARKRFVPPTIGEIRDYCNENGYRIDADAFIDHYQSVGWKVGNKPMKDWKAAVRTWARRDREKMPKKGETSFDTDDFFELAQKRAYSDTELSGISKKLVGVTA